MVEVIREKVIGFTSEEPVNGIFVFKKSNCVNQNIPQLSILYETEVHNLFYIKTESGVIEIGDIFEIRSSSRTIRTVLSSLNNENTLLLTEQCENKCLFCSQPPNNLPDNHLYQKAALSLLSFDTEDLVGLTGGEPTINKDAFLGLMKVLNTFGNKTPLHILSNGRNLGDNNFFENVIEQTNQREIMWAIPLYGHKSSLHDMIVGAQGAFNNTLNGLLNLSTLPHTIELRIVVVKQNYKYLKNILQFVNNSFPTISLISIMNLEPTGWARKNYEDLYVSVEEQNNYLIDTISSFNILRFDIKLLNYPLCLLHERLRNYAVKSISDWKNYYPEECSLCSKKDQCCGYFSSATQHYFEKPKAL